MSAPRNVIALPSGRVRAVCRICGRQTSPRPDAYDLPRGWWVAPFPADSVHPDGSTGSLYTCPSCSGGKSIGKLPKLDR